MPTLSTAQFASVRAWLARNARPLDWARFRFHFEGAGAKDVLSCLAAYQNGDGGFGHALEADCFGPHSSPIQTWCATEILREIGHTDGGHPIVQGILRYLDSGAGFAEGYWLAAVPENNDCPHAPWWTFDSVPKTIAEWGYNPTAALSGFAARFAPPGSPLRDKTEALIRRAVEAFLREPSRDRHEIACFLRLREDCEAAGLFHLYDRDALDASLQSAVARAIPESLLQWYTGYQTTPSAFLSSRKDWLYPAVSELSEAEVLYILDTLRQDGTWNVPWSWNAYPAEWAVARAWWTANQAIVNLRYLKGFDAL